MLKFGDIFRYKEHGYVYLAAKGDGFTNYVAQIVSDQSLITELIKKRDHILEEKNRAIQRKNIFTYLI